ncbi:MAG: DNA primase, partial [Kiritimatiellae bacterium]|nr:DNA primase [Kiritimatiellia bacterium]
MSQGITEATIEEIKLRTDLAELISSYGVDVRHAGSTLMACCPFHNEKTPSFNINQTKGFYHCFGCDESGDAIKFVQKMEGLSFVEAVKKLASRCGIEITERVDPEAGKRKRLYALMAELAQFYHRCLLKTKEAQIARDYLAKRNLNNEAQEEFLIGYAPNGMPTISKWAEKYCFTLEELEAAGVIKPPDRPGDGGYHRFSTRLMFTICDRQGRVVAFSGRQLIENKNSGKYVNSPETLIFKKSNVLFGFDKAATFIAKKREVILCEGQIDV